MNNTKPPNYATIIFIKFLTKILNYATIEELEQSRPTLAMHLLPLSIFALFTIEAAFASSQHPRHAYSPNGRQPRAAEAQVILASEGKELTPIVISPEATDEVEAAAKELAAYLNQITGADFKIKRSPTPEGITLGTLKEFPDPSLEEPLKIGPWNNGREAFAIRTSNGNIRLIGASELGAQHAAYRFLQLLGVRRYFSSKEWEIIPSRSTLAFDAEEESRPAIPSRRLWMAFGSGHGEQGERRKSEFASWSRHNRMAESTRLRNSHMYQEVYRRNKEEFDAHKEQTYAMIKGVQERPGKFNLANPRVRELLIETALAPLEKESVHHDMLSIEPSDGAGWSESPENLALGTISDRAFGLANELAARLRSMGRDEVQIGLLAYHLHAAPPAAPLDPLVNVALATRLYHGPYDLPRLKELWKEKTANLGIYDYFSTYVWGQERIRAASLYAPAADPKRVAEVIEEAVDDLKVRSFTAESLDNWALFGPGYYVAVQKMWDRNSNVDELMNDFYSTAFGPAEKPIREFYEILFPSSNRGVNYDTFRRLYERLDAAARAAESDPAITTRIDRLKQALHANLLICRKMLSDDQSEKRELSLKYYTLVYRTQDGNMMAAVPILDFSAPKDELLDLKGVQRKAYPWVNLPPMTHEETEAAFAEGLNFLKQFGDPVKPVTYSNDLVVVSLTDDPLNTKILASNPCVTFISREKGPVSLSIQTYGGTANRQVSYQIYDAENRKISSGQVPAAELAEEFEIHFDAPEAGIYQLRIPDYKSVAITAQTLPAAVIIDPQRDAVYSAAANEAKPFFYVPIGTTELVANVGMDTNTNLVLHDSYGRKIETPSIFGIVRVPIPEGEDGKLWSIGKDQKIGSLYFYNIPNIYSLDAQRVILPREIAEAEKKEYF